MTGRWDSFFRIGTAEIDVYKRQVHPVMYVISILFLLRYIIQVIPMPQ